MADGWGDGEWHDMLWGGGAYPYAPVDISYVRCTYEPTYAFTARYVQLAATARYEPAISVIPSAGVNTSYSRTVVHRPSVAKQGNYTPSIQKVGSP